MTVRANQDATPTLSRSVRLPHYFALAFGSTIGSAWVVVLGDWLTAAGPGGAILGFAIGGIAIAAIGMCYAELSSRIPFAGGEALFALRTFGPRTAFTTAWFLALLLISVTAFEGIAIALLAETLFPQALGPVLYEFAGKPVKAGALLIGTTGALLIAWLNYRGVGAAVRFQSIITVTFLVVALVAVTAGMLLGQADHLQPMFPSDPQTPWWKGTAWIIATCPFWLNGFQAAIQAVEERGPGVQMRHIAAATVLSILAASVFYIVVILGVGMAAPWKQSAASSLATATAMQDLLPAGLLMKAVMVAAILSLVKTWNGVALTAARLLFAQGRAHLLPPMLGRVHVRFGSPSCAVLLVCVLNVIGVLLGQGAILPIANTAAVCIGLTYALVCIATLKLRRDHPEQAAEYCVPGGVPVIVFALVASVSMASYGLIDPAMRMEPGRLIPVEWSLLAWWGAAGILCWLCLARSREEGRATGAALTQRIAHSGAERE